MTETTNKVCDITDHDSISSYLDKLVLSVLQSGGSVTWMGINISFAPTAKKRGGNVKRGKQWGRIKFADTSRQNSNNYEYLEITKERAIEIVLTPASLRRATTDLLNMKICYICQHMAFGKSLQLWWGELSYPKNLQRYSSGLLMRGKIDHIDICPDCIRKIKRMHNEATDS